MIVIVDMIEEAAIGEVATEMVVEASIVMNPREIVETMRGVSMMLLINGGIFRLYGRW